MLLQPGTQLGNYEVLSELGAGGMGEVYKAKDLKLGREVAIKVLLREMASDDDRLRRFQQEARAASALNHPNIVTIYEIGEHEGTPYIAMEYVDGVTLKEMLDDGALSDDKLIGYATQLVEGLTKAHQAGIVHRDLKPGNVVISADGYVKILDFGLAKLLPLDDAGSEVATVDKDGTTPGTVLGTISYMSPEQAKGESADFRSDQFSFGAVLYEMATGSSAFGRDTAAETLAAVLKEEPELDGALGAIVGRCLKKNPEERWGNTEELLGALKAPSKEEAPEQTIAVLPFSNMSADPEQEYFCDGMAEEIINTLTRVRKLRVVARTSSFMFKGRNVDIREIGEKLGVSHLLEGSVRKAGNRLRITAQLINVADGFHLWSERFDRELDDIFVIQDEISLAIVDQLHVNLVESEKKALVRRPTDRPELHNLYLLGRYHMHRFTLEDAKRSQEYFESIIALEPSYAPAYAGLAMVHHMYSGGGLGVDPPRDAMPKIKSAAERALELDPANGDAWTALALIGVFYDRDWPKVLHHTQEALTLDPSSTFGHMCYAYYLSVAQRFEEAIAEVERAVDLDPLAPVTLENAAWHHYHARNFERAREYCQKCFDLAPDFAWAHFISGLLDVQAGRPDTAKAAFERGEGTGFMKGYIGYAMAAYGDEVGAREQIEDLRRDVASGIGSSYSVALVYFGLGEVESCLDALEASTEEKPAILLVTAWLNVDPFWDPIREEPRFQEVLDRMSFPA